MEGWEQLGGRVTFLEKPGQSGARAGSDRRTGGIFSALGWVADGAAARGCAVLGPEPPWRAQAGGPPARLSANPGLSQDASVSEQAARAVRWGPGGGAFRSAPSGPPHAARKASFCCVCTCECARACVSAPVCREAAEERREAGALPAGVPRRAAGPPRRPSSGSRPWCGEMANFVSGFLAANKCLPVSGNRRVLIDSPPPTLLFFKSSVYRLTVCPKVRWVIWSTRRIAFYSVSRAKMYARIRMLVALVKPACLVLRTVLRPLRNEAMGQTFALQTL